MARLRSAAQRAPQTKEQALAIADRFATRVAERAAAVAAFEAELQKLKAVVDAVVLPIDAELKDLAKQLKPWFAANFEELTGGKRKSIELGGCLIGYRVSPPKVSFAGGDDDAAATALVDAKLSADLVRTTIAPDKHAILKLLEFKPGEEIDDADQAKLDLAARLGTIGFSTKQTETFFVDAVPSQASATGVTEAVA